ncbi:Subtilisin [Dactylellina cionopaga]|nr:Subtilisin [Dactylellina cionopaga]
MFQAADDDDAPIRCFTEFARLLMEIEYGPLPKEGDFNASNDYGWTTIRNFHGDRQRWGDLSKKNYLDAIEACLKFDKLFQTARATKSGRLETIDETCDRTVKVAVLDTGIDEEHPSIIKHKKQNGSNIKECKDWVGSDHGISDCVGHGTAVCDILLQVAKVDLFVGKISDSAEFDSTTPARVATAIEYATSPNGWNVDIIVLSLGFEDRDDAIFQAVTHAFNQQKIILAASSNSGSIIPSKSVAFPARMLGHVLNIRSATGQSVRSPASPKALKGDDNFMILGEGIEAAWPKEPQDASYTTRFVSGTSFATPVAAGIASLVLEFSVQKSKSGCNIPEDIAGILWTYNGIRKIFRYMSGVDEENFNADCSMIYPWKLFDDDRDYDGYKSEIKMLMKRI